NKIPPRAGWGRSASRVGGTVRARRIGLGLGGQLRAAKWHLLAAGHDVGAPAGEIERVEALPSIGSPRFVPSIPPRRRPNPLLGEQAGESCRGRKAGGPDSCTA